MEHYEFVVEFKNGKRDWVDPVDEVWEEGQTLFVKALEGYGYTYEYDKSLVDKWVVRPYDPETTFEPI